MYIEPHHSDNIEYVLIYRDKNGIVIGIATYTDSAETQVAIEMFQSDESSHQIGNTLTVIDSHSFRYYR